MIVSGKERGYVVHDDSRIAGFFGDYRFLSNFHNSAVDFNGITYPSVENAYQAQKVHDIPHLFERFQTCTASEAKQMGRSNPLCHGWDDAKDDIMRALLFSKFWVSGSVRPLLLATGTRHLEEANHWGDTYWGTCNGKGQNKLGRMLMSVRSLMSV